MKIQQMVTMAYLFHALKASRAAVAFLKDFVPPQSGGMEINMQMDEKKSSENNEVTTEEKPPIGKRIRDFLINIIDVLRNKNIPLVDKPRLCCGKYYTFVLYIFFGVITTIVNMTPYYLLVNLASVDPFTSTVIAWAIAVIFAFFANKLWVFKDKCWDIRPLLFQFFTFMLARLLSLGGEEIFLFVGITQCHISKNIVKIPAQVFVVLVNYVASKLVTFRKKDKHN